MKVGQIVSSLIQWLLRSKWKLLLSFFSCLIFLFILFPFDDLGDLVSAQVGKLTQNKLFLQFDQLKMSLFPQPGMRMKKVHIESIQTPAITAEDLTITPSIAGLIAKKPMGKVSAKGILKGDLQLEISNGSKSEAGVERSQIELVAKKMSLADIRSLVNLPVLLKGKLDLETIALADLSFTEQPEIDMNLKVSQFELPPANMNTAMGPLTLPELKLSQVDLKGKLSNGKFLIESGNIGQNTDELYGTIKGNMGLQIQNLSGVPSPLMGAYSIEIELNAKKSFQDRAGLFLSFLEAYKTPTADGAKFKFRISSQNFQIPPTIGAAR